MERHSKQAAQPSSTPLTANVGAAINAISFSPNCQQIVVAGREVLKVVDAKTFDEILPIRVGKVNLNYSSNDVKWNPFESHKHWLASAATNGAVVLWNLDNKERVILDHARTVNRVCWNPTDPFGLLSGSQDGTMRLWDLREAEGKSITFNAKSEVRDVQFSPFQPFVVAAGLENGAVQLWDTRKTAAPTHSITLHQGLVLAIAWHPTDKFMLATGGRDRIIQLWDVRTRAPSHSVQTISSVGRVTWRPPAHGPRASTHVVSSASLMDNSIHMWDYRRPYVPLATLQGARDVVTGHLWCPPQQHPNALISCSKDGSLRLHDLDRHAYIPAHHITATALSWNVEQNLVVVKLPRLDRLDAFTAMDAATAAISSSASHFFAPPPPPLPFGTTATTSTSSSSSMASSSVTGSSTFPSAGSSSSLTAAGGDFGSFNAKRRTVGTAQVRQQSPSSSSATTRLFEQWAGSAIVLGPVDDLDQPLSQQLSLHLPSITNASAVTPVSVITTATSSAVPVPGPDSIRTGLKFGFDPAPFTYLSENYLLHGSVADICEHNARAAKAIQRHDVAQTWLMLQLIFASSQQTAAAATGGSESQDYHSTTSAFALQAMVEPHCAPLVVSRLSSGSAYADPARALAQLERTFQSELDRFRYFDYLETSSSPESQSPPGSTSATTTLLPSTLSSSITFRSTTAPPALDADDVFLLTKLGAFPDYPVGVPASAPVLPVAATTSHLDAANDDGTGTVSASVLDEQYWYDLDVAKEAIFKGINPSQQRGNTSAQADGSNGVDGSDAPAALASMKPRRGGSARTKARTSSSSNRHHRRRRSSALDDYDGMILHTDHDDYDAEHGGDVDHDLDEDSDNYEEADDERDDNDDEDDYDDDDDDDDGRYYGASGGADVGEVGNNDRTARDDRAIKKLLQQASQPIALPLVAPDPYPHIARGGAGGGGTNKLSPARGGNNRTATSRSQSSVVHQSLTSAISGGAPTTLGVSLGAHSGATSPRLASGLLSPAGEEWDISMLAAQGMEQREFSASIGGAGGVGHSVGGGSSANNGFLVPHARPVSPLGVGAGAGAVPQPLPLTLPTLGSGASSATALQFLEDIEPIALVPTSMTPLDLAAAYGRRGRLTGGFGDFGADQDDDEDDFDYVGAARDSEGGVVVDDFHHHHHYATTTTLGTGPRLRRGSSSSIASRSVSDRMANFVDYVQDATADAASAVETMQISHLQTVWSKLVMSVLSHLESVGDVQNCAHMSIVIHQFFPIQRQQLMGWFLAYIGLLHRLKLWRCANDIIKCCPVESIREMNKKSTSYATSCGICRKPLFKASGVVCDRCKRVTGSCTICLQPVKGSYVWCQGCGHGGHLHHMRAWFATESACPSGCGHICSLKQQLSSCASSAAAPLPPPPATAASLQQRTH